MNKVILIGNIGIEPEVKTFSDGGQLASTTMATNKTWKDKQGNKQSKTEWHNLTFPKHLMGMVPHIHKGDKIAIEGELNYNENNGTWYTRIRVEKAYFVSSSNNNQGNGPAANNTQAQTTASQQYGEDSDDEDGLPF
jgi:single-strand DNA-binding protein